MSNSIPGSWSRGVGVKGQRRVGVVRWGVLRSWCPVGNEARGRGPHGGRDTSESTKAQATHWDQDPRGALICTDYSPRGPPPWVGSCPSPARLWAPITPPGSEGDRKAERGSGSAVPGKEKRDHPREWKPASALLHHHTRGPGTQTSKHLCTCVYM